MKITITEKMIDDFNDCILKTIDRETKEPVAVLEKYLLKQKGYEVEEEKTALEEAREFKLNEFKGLGVWLCSYDKVVEKINLYEKTIEKIQQKPVIDDGLIGWLERIIASDAHVSDKINAKRLLKQLGIEK